MPLDPLEITGGLAIGEGLGGAIADTVEPRLQSFKNGQWRAHTDKPLDPATAAAVAAENYDTYADMQTEASYTGFDATRFLHLYDVTLTGPGLGELLTMLRRGTIDGAGFAHGLRKAKLEPLWDGAISDLQHAYIGLGDIAAAIVRGAVPAPSWVPVAPPTSTDNVPRFPVTDIDPIALAGKLGFSEDMLRIMVARSGLSLAPLLATDALFRGELTENDWLLAIAEGDLRTEWAQTLKAAHRQIPTAGEAVQYQLRGFTGDGGRYALTRLHGMTDAHSDVLYDIAGRAPSDRQVYIGLARGAKYPSTYDDVPSPFREAIQRSDIRPEFADIVYQNRYSLPSAFVVRSLLTDGAISADRGSTILQHEGWPADLADLVAQHYAGGTGTKADAHVVKAQNQLWTTTHSSYKGYEISDASATSALEAAGVEAASVPAVLSLWQHERELIRKQLSAAQVKKAWGEQVTDPALGRALTQQEAVARLMELGYGSDDAAVFLVL